MKTSTTIIRFLPVLLISCLLLSCGGGGGGGGSAQVATDSQYASLEVSLGSPSRGTVGTSQLPADITRATVACSGPGMTEIRAELPLDGTPAIISDIPPGVNRVVTINTYNNQLLRMSGSTTIARLTAGTRTSVSIRVEDVAIMLISLDPIVDLASAVDATTTQVALATSIPLYCGITNHVDTSVTWYVDGILGGSSGAGTISTGGWYTAPGAAGTHVIQAISNEDPTLTDSITVSVVTGSPAPPVPPEAVAGPDRTVLEGTTVNLDGSGSSNGDGTITSYQWVQTGGATVTLSNADSATPFFVAPNLTSADTLTFELTVTDNNSATDSDSISIIVQPAGTEFHISPKIVHLLPSVDQQFVSTAPSNWWEVNGTEGGDNTIGTIDTMGYYNAPVPSTNPMDVVITAVEAANTSNSDDAKVAVVLDDTWQKTYRRGGYTVNSDVSISLGNIIGPYPQWSNIAGTMQNTSTGERYLFFDQISDTIEYGAPESLAFYQLPNSWDSSDLSILRTSPYSYDDEFLVAAETSLPSGPLDKAIGLVRADRHGSVDWAYQYETGPTYISYPCVTSRYPFQGAVANTPGNGFLIGFSRYSNDECNLGFQQYLRFYVIDQNGTLLRNILIDPNYQPPTNTSTAEMFVDALEPTSDGGYLAVINVNIRPDNSTSHSTAAPVLVKLDSTYNLVWARQFSQTMRIRHITPDASTGFYLNSSSNIVHIDANGTVLSQFQLGSTGNTAVGIRQVYYYQTDGGLLIEGSWRTPTPAEYHIGLIKTDSNLNIEWQHTYGNNPGNQGWFSSIYARNGSFFLSGFREIKGATNNENETMVLRIPADTGQLAEVGESHPFTPDFTLTASPSSATTDITTGTTYSDDDTSGIEVNQLNPVAVAIPPAIISHTVSDRTLTIAISSHPDESTVWDGGEQIQFHASLSHLLSDTSVTWSVNGIDGGNATVGTIDNTGLYTSPSSVSSDTTVIIRATSVEEPSLYKGTNLTIESSGGGGS